MADWPTAPPTAPPSAPGLRAGGASYPAGPPEQWPAYAPAPPWGGGPAGPGGPPPPPERGPGRTGAVILTAGALIAVVALLIVAIGALATSDGGEEATDTTVDLSDPEITAPPSEEPVDPMPTMPSIPMPDLGPDPAERARPLDEVLPELIAFVEETREQEFVEQPDVEAVPDAEFEQRLAEEQGEGVEDLEDAAVAVTALGLLPPDFDLAGAMGELGATSIFGFYDPETAELVVKGDMATPFVQSVIVHELTHALDDQVHGLGRLEELIERPDESAFAFQSLVEGTASHVQDAFVAQMSPEDAAAFEAEQLAIGFDQMPSAIRIPPFLLVQGQVPYVSGQRFVEALVDEGGMAAVDAAYDAPPTTGEQILEPEVFLAGEGPVELRPLEAPAGVAVADEGAFGAVDLRLLDLVVDPMAALIDPDLGLLEPVPGFGGGRYVSWTEGDRSCIALEAIGDDEDGTAVIQDALETWAGYAPSADVSSRVGGNGRTVVTATSCA
ncbi:MAG TPA: hypothetical protein VFU19_13275 [Iamia sp.]|nr:hypothetical protein [Iamia sp.]